MLSDRNLFPLSSQRRTGRLWEAILFPMVSHILNQWEEMVETRCAVLTKCLWGACLRDAKEPMDAEPGRPRGRLLDYKGIAPSVRFFLIRMLQHFITTWKKKARASLKGLTFIVTVLTEIISRLLCVCTLRTGTASGSTPRTYAICYTCWQNITTLGGIKDSLETSSALTPVCTRINTADVNTAGPW